MLVVWDHGLVVMERTMDGTDGDGEYLLPVSSTCEYMVDW
jgi:hypothetical protein